MRRLGAALLLVLASAPSVYADDVDTWGGKMVEIEARVRELDGELRPPAAEGPELADRRLIDAQVLYELKNYEAASTLLLDVVQKYPNSQAYPEALFYLADSLFLIRDFLSSRRYFEKVVETGPSNKRYQEALQRLIELSLYTGDYSPVDGYIAKLAELPPGHQLPSVPYVKGKYYYFRQRYDEALNAFKDINQSHKYWFHSQYFVGATYVAQGKLTEAIGAFDGVLKVEAKTDSQKRIAELSHLALGRIYYDRGQFTNANVEYSKISSKSELFADSLFEQAWVSIKAKEYKKAFRALDTLLTAKPDDPQVPEVKLLIGNLHIRENEYMLATDAFSKTRDEFEPIHKQMDDIINKQTDPQRYFQELIGKNLGKFDVSSYLPPIAIKWVKAESDIQHVVNLVTDVNDLKKSLDESDEIVRRLDKAVTGPGRVNIFPELATARSKAVEIGNQIGDAKKALLSREHDLEAPVAGSERAQLDSLAAQRQAIEAKLASTPSTADDLATRLKKAKGNFDDLDKRASELNVLIHSFHAERVAIELYYKTTTKGQKVDTSQFEKEAAQVQAMEDDLQKQYDQLRRDIDEAAQSVGVDDAQMQLEAQLRKQLGEIQQQERSVGASVRLRLSGEDRTKVDQIESILSRAQAAEGSLASFNAKIDEQVEARLVDIKTSIAEEKANVEKFRIALGQHEGEAVTVGGGITAESFKAVADRFYQIVVRSDVGIIDVAWALKDNKTQEDSRLVREQKRELKLLDDEFKGVLKE
jgi:tetratricopeptide (TPR) repeat protein